MFTNLDSIFLLIINNVYIWKTLIICYPHYFIFILIISVTVLN